MVLRIQHTQFGSLPVQYDAGNQRRWRQVLPDEFAPDEQQQTQRQDDGVQANKRAGHGAVSGKQTPLTSAPPVLKISDCPVRTSAMDTAASLPSGCHKYCQ